MTIRKFIKWYGVPWSLLNKASQVPKCLVPKCLERPNECLKCPGNLSARIPRVP